MSEKEGCKTFTITFKYTKALYHEGCGGANVRCQKCQVPCKRYYRLKLIDGDSGIVCRGCFDGEEDGYDDSFDSEKEY